MLTQSPIILDKISNTLFLLGLTTSVLSNLLAPHIAPVVLLTSQVAYLIAYSSWYISSLFYKNHPKQQDTWSPFSNFKKQYQMSALLGSIAVLLCITIPTITVSASWLILISNIHWSIGEYYKKTTPPSSEPDYSDERQAIYFYYTLAITLASLITAFTATIIFFAPPLAPIILPIVLIANGSLSVLAAILYAKYSFETYPADNTLIERNANNSPSIFEYDISKNNRPRYSPLRQAEPKKGSSEEVSPGYTPIDGSPLVFGNPYNTARRQPNNNPSNTDSIEPQYETSALA